MFIAHNERGCVTLWAIGMILSLDHEGNEHFSAQPLLRMKALHGGKAIHPKLPIEVHFDRKGEHNFYWALLTAIIRSFWPPTIAINEGI